MVQCSKALMRHHQSRYDRLVSATDIDCSRKDDSD